MEDTTRTEVVLRVDRAGHRLTVDNRRTLLDGFCTPGQICSAAGMLVEHAAGWPSAVSTEDRPQSTAAEVRERMSGNLCGYHIAAHAYVPDVRAEFVDDHEPGDPSGIKGAGEIGTVGTAAAIANAVWHATGVRQRTLPIRLDRVLEGGSSAG